MQDTKSNPEQGTVIIIPSSRSFPASEDQLPCPPLGAEGEAQRAAMEKAEAKS